MNKENDNTIVFVVPSEDGDHVELSFKTGDTRKIDLPSSETRELIGYCTTVAQASDYELLVLNY